MLPCILLPPASTSQCRSSHLPIPQFMRLGSAPRYSEDDVYRPDQRLRLGLGARTSSTSDDVLLTVTAKQKVRLAKGTDVVRGRQVLRSYTQAAFKARYDYNVRTESWSGEAVAAVSHAMFRFSDDQDLRLTAGCRVPLTARGAGEPHPFVRLEENSWSVTADTKGGWKMMYAL